MRKTAIRITIITTLIIGCTVGCYFSHLNPFMELVKFSKNKRVNYPILFLPVVILALIYFIYAIDWELLFANSEQIKTEEKEKSPETNNNLLKTTDHEAEQRRAEEKLRALTNRELIDEPKSAPKMVSVKEEELLGGIEDGGHSDEFLSTINSGFNRNLRNSVEIKEGEEEIKYNNMESIGPVSPAEYKIENEPFQASDNLEVNSWKDGRVEVATGIDENAYVHDVATSLPEPLDAMLISNVKAIQSGDFAIDERDRLDMISFLKKEKSFARPVRDFANIIIEKLDELGRDYLQKQEVAAMLETDNSLLITEKKSNTIKDRVRRQLLEKADIQDALLKRN